MFKYKWSSVADKRQKSEDPKSSLRDSKNALSMLMWTQLVQDAKGWVDYVNEDEPHICLYYKTK